MAEALDLSIPELARLLAHRGLSPVELAREALARIDRLNGTLGAFVTVCGESALESAREAEREIDRGHYRGPLHGIPVAVKDLIEMAGLPTEAGSRVLRGFTPQRDATVVKRLREAGAVIVGKTALDEFAFTTVGRGIKNPLDPARSPGGSSGGSAVAVAAGMCAAAIGTDTGGSNRIPAACCGAVGLKPTYGRVSKAGVIPLAWSLDHVGVLAKRAADAAAALQSIAGYDPDDQSSAPGAVPSYTLATDVTAGLRVGMPVPSYLGTVNSEIRTAFDTAMRMLSGLGADLREVRLPDVDFVLDFHYVTVLAEAATYHLRRFPNQLQAYGEQVRSAIEAGSRIRVCDYLDAQRVRAQVCAEVCSIFHEIDVLAMPTLAVYPPPVGVEDVLLGDGRREDVVSAMIRFTCTFNHTGHPAMSIPCCTNSRWPAGLQLIGRHFDELRLISVAHAYQQATAPYGTQG